MSEREAEVGRQRRARGPGPGGRERSAGAPGSHPRRLSSALLSRLAGAPRGRDPGPGPSPGPGRPRCGPYGRHPQPWGRPHLRTPDLGDPPPSPISASVTSLHLKNPPRPLRGQDPHCLDQTTSSALRPSLHRALPHPHLTDCPIGEQLPNFTGWSLSSRARSHPLQDHCHFSDNLSESTPFGSLVRLTS